MVQRVALPVWWCYLIDRHTIERWQQTEPLRTMQLFKNHITWTTSQPLTFLIKYAELFDDMFARKVIECWCIYTYIYSLVWCAKISSHECLCVEIYGQTWDGSWKLDRIWKCWVLQQKRRFIERIESVWLGSMNNDSRNIVCFKVHTKTMNSS